MSFYEKVPGAVEAIRLGPDITINKLKEFFGNFHFSVTWDNSVLELHWKCIDRKGVSAFAVDELSELDVWDLSTNIIDSPWLVRDLEGIHAVKDVVFRANYREIEK